MSTYLTYTVNRYETAKKLLVDAVDKNKSVYEFFVRDISNPNYIDVKICVAGNVDSGKSTLLGYLTYQL